MMAIDVYSPCPCGSGKKIKFCCGDLVEDMQQVLQLRGERQPRQALNLLEKLEATHPRNAWLLVIKGSIQADLGQFDEALRSTDASLAIDPLQPAAVATRAMLLFRSAGFDAARPAIEHAFETLLATHPQALAPLASSAAVWFGMQRKLMALRQHLVFAVILSMEQEGGIVDQLIQFDQTREIPYLLRSQFARRNVTLSDSASQASLEDAERLADCACWTSAAELLKPLAERHPQNANLWHNLGLWQGWSGDQAAAAQSLHHSARVNSDFEHAVEDEALAQTLDLEAPENRIGLQARSYPVRSVSRLLTRLDQQPTFVRIPDVGGPGDEKSGVAGAYQVLDVPQSEIPLPLKIDRLAHVEYDVVVSTEGKGGEPAHVQVRSRMPDATPVWKAFEELAGDEIVVDNPQERDHNSYAREDVTGDLRWVAPDHLPDVEYAAIAKQMRDQVLNQKWPHLPRVALGGKTPLQAVDVPELRVPLAAALYVLDQSCDREQWVLSLDDFRSRYKLPAIEPLRVTDDLEISGLSFLELRRLPLHELSDEQLELVLSNSLTTGHSGFIYNVLTEAVARPGLQETIGGLQAYRTLADLCQERDQTQEALAWVERGRTASRGHKQAFELRVVWDMKELQIRLNDPRDPQLLPLFRRMWYDYGPKIPGLREDLLRLAAEKRIDAPWMSAELAGRPGEPAAGSLTDGGIWTPEGAAATGQPGKLWLPGQD